jgi:hypothetical protein
MIIITRSFHGLSIDLLTGARLSATKYEID